MTAYKPEISTGHPQQLKQRRMRAMSNNRMYLVHEPTGFALLLGKRLQQGYSVSFDDIAERLETLYDLVGYDEEPDSFLIAYEHASKTGRAWSKIEAVEPGIYKIELAP